MYIAVCDRDERPWYTEIAPKSVIYQYNQDVSMTQQIYCRTKNREDCGKIALFRSCICILGLVLDRKAVAVIYE